jgi:hypothetical protein
MGMIKRRNEEREREREREREKDDINISPISKIYPLENKAWRKISLHVPFFIWNHHRSPDVP